jgi:dihydrofolate reductase
MQVTMIAAMDEERALSRGGRVPWDLPADVAMFRVYCEGKALLAGRRTWEQMAGWFRAGQLPLVLTRRSGLEVPGGRAVGTVEEAVLEARERGYGELVVIGGGETYGAAMGVAGRLILTEVQGRVGGDVFFPALDPCEWEVKDEVHHAADEAHEFAFTIRRFERRAIETTDEPL